MAICIRTSITVLGLALGDGAKCDGSASHKARGPLGRGQVASRTDGEIDRSIFKIDHRLPGFTAGKSVPKFAVCVRGQGRGARLRGAGSSVRSARVKVHPHPVLIPDSGDH